MLGKEDSVTALGIDLELHPPKVKKKVYFSVSTSIKTEHTSKPDNESDRAEREVKIDLRKSGPRRCGEQTLCSLVKAAVIFVFFVFLQEF